MKSHLKTAERLAALLDDKFSVGGFKFGIDPILNVVPWLGDLIGAVLSCYILWIGVRMSIPKSEIVKMILNILVDFLIGLIPFLGIVGDLFYKANRRNVIILKKYKDRHVIEGEIIS